MKVLWEKEELRAFLVGPGAITIGDDGNLYVAGASTGLSWLLKYNKEGQLLGETRESPPEFPDPDSMQEIWNYPREVNVAPSAGLYVLNETYGWGWASEQKTLVRLSPEHHILWWVSDIWDYCPTTNGEYFILNQEGDPFSQEGLTKLTK